MFRIFWAFLSPFCALCLNLYRLMDITAVSVPEKKADKIKRMSNKIKYNRLSGIILNYFNLVTSKFKKKTNSIIISKNGV